MKILKLAALALLVSRSAFAWPTFASSSDESSTPSAPTPSSSPTVPAGDAEVCDIDGRSALRHTYVKRTPSYFFRAFPDSLRISYASELKNYILNLETGEETLVPGLYDPVPTHDERYMTIPSLERGLGFYSMKDLETQGEKAKPLLEDVQVKGIYQSTGILEESSGETTYRVITDRSASSNKTSPSFRDYPITHQGENGAASVYASTLEPHSLCTDRELSLPILSRDGKQLAAVENNPDGTRSTKIFDIDAKTGACKVSLDLGFETGKVDFSFNNDDITFHVSSNSLDAVSGYFAKPGEHFVSNVYLYKRSTKEIRRLTNNTVGNSVYPSFRRDGTIVYVTHGPEVPGIGNAVAFTHADPNQERAKPLRSVVPDDCCGGDRKKKDAFEALVALGSLWAHACTRYGTEFDAAPAALTTLSLDPVRCRKLVFEHWEALREQVAQGRLLKTSKKVDPKAIGELEIRDLLAACPPLPASADATPEPAAPPPIVVRPFERTPEPAPPDAVKKRRSAPRPTGTATRPAAPRTPAPATKPAEPPINPVATCIACHANIPFNDVAKLKTMKPLMDGSNKNHSMYDEIWRRTHLPPGTTGAMPMGTTLGCKQRKALVCHLNPADAECKVQCP